MNVRNHLIEIQCSYRNVNDVAQAIVHSIVFFRTHGKFNYKHEGSYSIGTLGFESACCDCLDFSYIRCSSPYLVNRINSKIQEFSDKVNECTQCASLALEFYTRKPSRWPFNDSKIVWELWNIKIIIASGSVLSQSSVAAKTIEHSFSQPYRPHSGSTIRLEDLLGNKILDIVKIVNSEKCSLPQMPIQPNLDTVFDTNFSDLQPYLFNLSYKISDYAPGSHPATGTTTMKFGDAGSMTDHSAQSSLKKFLLGTLEL